jgi:hypothetical protein
MTAFSKSSGIHSRIVGFIFEVVHTWAELRNIGGSPKSRAGSAIPSPSFSECYLAIPRTISLYERKRKALRTEFAVLAPV